MIINPQFSSLIPFLPCLEYSKITSLKIAGKWRRHIVSTTRGHLQRKEPGFFKPAIRLKRQKKTDKNKYDKKLNILLATYKTPMAYFRDRTPKEWLFFKKWLTWCLIGKKVTSRAAKYALARQLLTGCALADFNSAATLHRNKSIANCTQRIQAVTLQVFPRKTLQDQKHWMRNFLKKPQGMPVQEYISHETEINYYLKDPPSYHRQEHHQDTRR